MCYQATRRQRPPAPISLDIETLALERMITAVTPPPRGILDNAACADTDPDAFFEEPGSGIGRAAKRVCKTCPVMAECLEWALDNHEVYGVWGGTSEKQRRVIRAQRKAAE
jgi:WhiB family redox-sensing transcriptional regulator